MEAKKVAAQMGASVGVWIYSLLERSLNHQLRLNPLVPSAHKSVRIAKISILKLEGIIK